MIFLPSLFKRTFVISSKAYFYRFKIYFFHERSPYFSLLRFLDLQNATSTIHCIAAAIGRCQHLPDVEVESVAHSNVVQMPMALCQATGEVSPARRAGRGVIVTTW